MDIRDIYIAFQKETLPTIGNLVKLDGYDQLDKEAAIHTFSGKTSDEVLRLLNEGGWGNAYNELDELVVLESPAIRYYIAPFLIKLASEISERKWQDEYVSNVLCRLLEIARTRDPNLFNVAQREVISQLVSEVLEGLQSSSEAREVGGDVLHYAEQCVNLFSQNKGQI